MKNFLIFFLCLLFSFESFSQQSIYFYVSSSGKDSNPGSIEKPFASLEKARKEVRKILSKENSISVTVYLRGGNYFIKNSVVFDSLDSGTGDNAVTYTSYNNETVSFSGGVSIPVKYATLVTNDLVLNRFHVIAKNKILQIDLKKLGI